MISNNAISQVQVQPQSGAQSINANDINNSDLRILLASQANGGFLPSVRIQ